MARGRRKNRIMIPQAAQAMDQFKYEVASELGINPDYESGYWGNISSRECGAVGGHMVRKMIAAAEHSLMRQEGGFDSKAIQEDPKNE
jgi:small acid-soluble spore protein D (minor alpha/beta-type SASP)